MKKVRRTQASTPNRMGVWAAWAAGVLAGAVSGETTASMTWLTTGNGVVGRASAAGVAAGMASDRLVVVEVVVGVASCVGVTRSIGVASAGAAMVAAAAVVVAAGAAAGDCAVGEE